MIRLKRMMAVVIAMVMVICAMNVTSFAEVGDLQVNNTLTVSGLGANDTVAYYQILKWDGEVETGWNWGSGVTVTEDKVGGLAVTDIIGATDGENKITADIAGTLASNLGTAVEEGMAVSGDTWTVSDVDAGLYMVIVTSKTAGTMYNPIFVAANYYGTTETPDESNKWALTSDLTYSNQGMAKMSTIPVDKKTTGSTDEDYDNADDDTATVDVGEVLDFEVNTTIPKYGSNYTKPVFKVVDTLVGLELQGDPEVTASGTALSAGTDYDLETSTDGYTITFTQDYLKSVGPAGQEITITYSAKVTDAAEKIVNQEKNTVEVKFSTDPKDEDGHGLIRDETNHFTFSIDAGLNGDEYDNESSTEAIKIGVDKEGNPILSEQSYATSSVTHSALAGAEFGLYKNADCTELYKNDIYKDGVKVTSDETGRITIKGLDVGEYWLKEEKAPAGFIKMQDPIPVIIEAVIVEDEEVKEEVDYDGTTVEVTYKTNRVDTYTVTIGGSTTSYTITNSKVNVSSVTRNTDSSDSELVNTKGVELPATGGMGTKVFYIVGAVLVLGAGILLVTRRRMDSI